jgi:peptidoglycan/LPS O-acetylase OafA/YrhL
MTVTAPRHRYPVRTGEAWAVNRWVPAIEPLRGVAALAVVVHHAWRQAYAPPIFPVAYWLGDWGVALFFVVSGFCIHLPQAAKERAQPACEVDWRKFFYRRAVRILPAYYAALVLSALIDYAIPMGAYGHPGAANLIAHVLMIHVWYFPFFHSVNPVFWTIAIECQFYLAYPIYLAMRRKFDGYLPMLLLLAGMAIFLSSIVFPKGGGWRFVWQRLFVVYWWQWSLGAFLADCYTAGRRTRWFGLVSFRQASMLWGGASLALAMVKPAIALWLVPLACFLMLAAIVIDAGFPRLAVLSVVGSFSYSLYLVHPVALALLTETFHRSDGPLALIVYVAFSVLLGGTFYMAVERPFLVNRGG